MGDDAVALGLSNAPMDMRQARLMAKHAAMMELPMLTGAYVCIAKFRAEVSDDERRELDDILDVVSDLIRAARIADTEREAEAN